MPVGAEADQQAIPRHAADSLLAVARASRIGGSEGESILVDGRRRLRAQQVVGVLAARDATLEILPKIDGLDAGATRQNLIHMLARIYELHIADGALTELGSQQHDLLEVLIRLFTDKLFEAVRRGLPRRYVTQSEDLPGLRGRLDAQRQFTVLAASPQKLACRYDELSPDIPLNQIVGAAVRRLRAIARSSGNQRRLAELSLAYSDVTAIPTSALPWDLVFLDRTSAAWAAVLSLARLLLGDRYQTTSLGEADGFSLLFEMNTLFEEYIGRTLRKALAGSGLEVQLQGPRSYALQSADGNHFATRPDIVISRGGERLLIIDTKWKRLKGAINDRKQGVSQADVYQMMAYAQIYRCERLMLLYPHHDGLDGAEGLLSCHHVSGTARTNLAVATVSLSDLTGVGERLVAAVHALQGAPTFV
jgi:5-methylcytosine-specific restriction enzyme subunit McrC